MRRFKKQFIIILLVIFILLTGVYYVLAFILREKWTEGIYPYKNTIVVYTDTTKVLVHLPMFAVGNQLFDVLSSKRMRLQISGDDEEITAEYSIVSSIEYTHYRLVDLLLSIDLDEGGHSFTTLNIQSDDAEESAVDIGNININVDKPEAVNDKVLGSNSASRVEDSCDFIYGIQNTGEEAIEITEILTGIEEMLEFNMSVIGPVELENGTIDLLAGEPYYAPVSIPAGKQVYFIFRRTLSEDEKTNFYYINPVFTYQYAGSNNKFRLYLKDYSNPQIVEMTADEVFHYISQEIE